MRFEPGHAERRAEFELLRIERRNGAVRAPLRTGGLGDSERPAFANERATTNLPLLARPFFGPHRADRDTVPGRLENHGEPDSAEVNSGVLLEF